MSVRVLLADDQELMRMGFRMVIESQSDLEIVGEAGNGREALEAASELKPDIVLMDVRMPELDGIEATRRIVAGDDRIRIIVLTTFDLDEYAYAALRAGASGFLLKDAPPAELLAAIRAVASGDAVIAPSVTRRLLAKFMRHLPDPAAPQPPGNPGLAQLTPREREVLIEVARSHSNAEVAERLVLSEATVKTHVGRILAKLSLRDRVQIVVFAYENGLIRPAIDTWGGGALDAPDGRALDVRSARAADARDGDAVDTVGGEAADRRGGEAADRRGGEAADRRGGEAADRRGGEAADRRGGEAVETVGGEDA